MQRFPQSYEGYIDKGNKNKVILFGNEQGRRGKARIPKHTNAEYQDIEKTTNFIFQPMWTLCNAATNYSYVLGFGSSGP